MNDTSIPLAYRGHGLQLNEYSELSESDPQAWIDLVFARVFAIWFGSLDWDKFNPMSDDDSIPTPFANDQLLPLAWADGCLLELSQFNDIGAEEYRQLALGRILTYAFSQNLLNQPAATEIDWFDETQ